MIDNIIKNLEHHEARLSQMEVEMVVVQANTVVDFRYCRARSLLKGPCHRGAIVAQFGAGFTISLHLINEVEFPNPHPAHHRNHLILHTDQIGLHNKAPHSTRLTPVDAFGVSLDPPTTKGGLLIETTEGPLSIRPSRF